MDSRYLKIKNTNKTCSYANVSYVNKEHSKMRKYLTEKNKDKNWGTFYEIVNDTFLV